MATLPVKRLQHGWRPTLSRQDTIAFACLGVVLLLQTHMVLTRAINWDEFWYYAQVEQFARGVLAGPLQTIHVRLFTWLTDLPGNGVDHIITGRVAMFAAELATLVAIGGISAHFTDRTTGVLCVLAYLGSLFVFQHGFSFRADPLAAGLSMTALVVLLKSRPSATGLAVFALFAGLAGMVTIKTVLLAPAFAGVAWLRLAEADDRRRALLWVALCALGAGLVFAALYGLHAQALVAADSSARAGMGTASSAADYALKLGLPAYFQYAINHAIKSPLQVLLMLAAPFAIARSDLSSARKIALAGMLASALVFFVYRNTLPYFYAFILPPIVCGTAVAMRAAAQRYSLAFVAVVLSIGPVVAWTREPPSPIEKQRLIVDAADAIFRTPVVYFDFCAMLGTFHKANPFMTTWGMKAYREAGVPVMRQAMLAQVVPLVLAIEQENYPTFREMLGSRGSSKYFLPEDAAALRDNYLPFWGPFWLAGKAVPPGGAVQHETFLVPGPYTVHDAPVRVDGQEYRPGDVLVLERGVHELRTVRAGAARLIWGERLAPPAAPAPSPPYWTDF